MSLENINYSNLYIMNLFNKERENELRLWMAEKGIHSVWLDGTRITNKADLFREFNESIYSEGFVVKSWNGFEDIFRSFLYSVEYERVILVWKDAEGIVSQALGDLLEVSGIFFSMSREVYKGGPEFKKVKSFKTLLLGSGESFN